MEMKFGKTGFARRLVKQNTGLVFGGEEIRVDGRYRDGDVAARENDTTSRSSVGSALARHGIAK